MSTELDEEIDVDIVDAKPAVFWRGKAPYDIVEAQVFYRRIDKWWIDGNANKLDTEFWRVSAQSGDGPVQLYDLRRDADPDTWRLALSWDD